MPSVAGSTFLRKSQAKLLHDAWIRAFRGIIQGLTGAHEQAIDSGCHRFRHLRGQQHHFAIGGQSGPRIAPQVDPDARTHRRGDAEPFECQLPPGNEHPSDEDLGPVTRSQVGVDKRGQLVLPAQSLAFGWVQRQVRAVR